MTDEELFIATKLDRSAIQIGDADLCMRIARVTPLIFKGGKLYTFDIPHWRTTAFTWKPQNLVEVPNPQAYEVVEKTRTMHACGYHAYFKPSIAEALAQLPPDERINAFYLDLDTVQVLDQGEGHLVEATWLHHSG